jgi:hypothetical protein
LAVKRKSRCNTGAEPKDSASPGEDPANKDHLCGLHCTSWTVGHGLLSGRPHDHGSAQVTITGADRLQVVIVDAKVPAIVPARSVTNGVACPISVVGVGHRTVAQPAAHPQEVGAHQHHPQRDGGLAKVVEPQRGGAGVGSRGDSGVLVASGGIQPAAPSTVDTSASLTAVSSFVFQVLGFRGESRGGTVVSRPSWVQRGRHALGARSRGLAADARRCPPARLGPDHIGACLDEARLSLGWLGLRRRQDAGSMQPPHGRPASTAG